MNVTTIDKFVFGCYPFKKDKKEQNYEFRANPFKF